MTVFGIARWTWRALKLLGALYVLANAVAGAYHAPSMEEVWMWIIVGGGLAYALTRWIWNGDD